MNKRKLSISIIWVVYTAGIIGLLTPYQLYFQYATPITILISAALLIWNQEERTARFYVFAIICFVIGFLAEFLGVNYSLIFGNYKYGKTLGYQFLNVPLLIGVNWLITIYSIGVVIKKLRLPIYLFILFGALIAVAFDWLLEPVAVHFDFWNWENGTIPVKNYIGWFFLSAFLLISFEVLKVKSTNGFALTFLVAESLFFLTLHFAIQL